MRTSLLLLALLGSCLVAEAQFTSSSGTVTDNTGVVYASASVSCSIGGGSVQAPTIGGSPVPSPVTGTTDGSGNVTLNLADNSKVQPTGTNWRCTVIAQPNAPQFSVTTTVSGVTATLPFAGAMPPQSSLNYVPNNGALSGPCDWYQLGTDYTTTGSLYNCGFTPPSLTGTWNAVSGGSGGGLAFQGTPTTSAFVTTFNSTKIQNPSATSTLDPSGNAIFTGNVSSGSGSGVAGGFEFKNGTTNTPQANSFLLQAPTSITTGF